MKHSAIVLILTALGITLVPRAAATEQRPFVADLAIVGGLLIDGFGGPPLENAVVLVEGDTIVAIGRTGELTVPEGAEVIDANGMTILPGLWESHGHLQIFGAGAPPALFLSEFPDRVVEVMSLVAEIELMAGVTSFRDLGGPLEEQKSLRDEIESGRKKGPRLYLAGPTVKQKVREGESDPFSVGSPQDARRIVSELVRSKADQIWAEGPWELENLRALAEEAHAVGLGVDLGVRHAQACEIAVKAGIDRLHSVFTADALSSYSDEELRVLVRGERPMALGPSSNILRGPYVAPGMEMRESYVRALRFPETLDHPRFRSQFPPDIYDFLQRTWESPQSIPWGIGSAERMPTVKAKVRRFIEAGGREQILAGTDAGSPLNFHPSVPREIANLVDAGLSPMESIQAATLRPAQMQGVDDRLGTIAVGKLADLIVVDGFPLVDIGLLQTSVVHVIKDGVVYK